MYNWIETTFNVSGGVTQAIAVILALSVVLLLFGLFIFVLKRLMGGQTSQNRNRQPRIAVMDTASVDTRRRLVLIRRDNIEHLLLVGGPSDVVVEQNIIRNTPLTQARPGHPAPAGLAGTAPVRGPMAPGPDIPVRPDDLVAQSEPVPPPAAQARPPASPARSTPSMQSPSASARPQTAEPDQPSAPASRDRPDLASPGLNTPSPAMAPAEAPVKSADAGKAAATVQADAPHRGPNRAADLLRAATQNGFGRNPSKAPALAREEDPKQAENAPAVRPAAKPSSLSQPAESGKPVSRLSSLARPFSPRDRPSYGTQSITPPASGPAARAKTALLKPLESPQQQSKVEPVLAAAPVKVAAEAADPVTGAEVTQKSDSQSERTSMSPAVSLPATDTAPSAVSVDNAGAENADGEELPAAPLDGPSQAGQGQVHGTEASTPDQDEPGNMPAQPASEPHPDIAAEKSPAPGIELDMSDLLEPPAASAEAQVETAEPARTEGTAPVPAPQETEAPGKEPEEPHSPLGDASPVAGEGEIKKTVEPVRTAPRPTTGLGDKNPIEDEMAKILDELGGQPN